MVLSPSFLFDCVVYNNSIVHAQVTIKTVAIIDIIDSILNVENK